MIAASDPLEYVPGGRQTILRHPGSVVAQQSANNQTAPGESFILQRLSQVNITEKTPQEFWSVRENETYGEEELYWSGKIAVHSKGSGSTRSLQTSYSCDSDIKHALWCVFHSTTPENVKHNQADFNEPSGSPIECICLLDSYNLKVFTETGEDYVSSLQFQVSSVWATKYGILLEKSPAPTTVSRYASLEASKLVAQSENQLPTAFSLKHPLDEICPLLLKHGSLSYVCDSHQKIVFTSSEPSLAVVYDTRTGLHSVYKIRKASADECHVVCGNDTTTSIILNHSATASPLNIGSNLSTNRSSTSKAHVSIFGIPNLQSSGIGMGISLGGGGVVATSPFASRATSYTTGSASGASPSQQQHSRSQSPMAAISRSESPTTFSPLLGGPSSSIAHQTRLHHTVMATILGQSPNSPSSPCNSLHLQDAMASPSRPLYPELCLDHVWTENVGVSKDIISGPASKVLLTSDLVGQSYLGYLVPNRSQLFLVRLEKSNKQQQIIFGMVTSIVAKDAVSLPKLHMILTIDLSNGVSLYSGVTCIGKVHIAGVLSPLASSNYYLPNFAQKLGSSPFPRRSSLIVPNCPMSHELAKFDEGLHLLSPVTSTTSRLPIMLENSMLDTSLVALKEAVSNTVTLEYETGKFFRISLPAPSTSSLVTICLSTLRGVLQRDLAMQLLVKWYGARNAPGPQDFGPTQEWNLFVVVILTLLGYDVDKVPLVQSDCDNDQPTGRSSPSVLPKKQKTNDSGSNDDWLYVMKSTDQKNSQEFISDTLGLAKLRVILKSMDDQRCRNTVSNTPAKINSQAILFPYLPLVLFSLHLVYEDLKLNLTMSDSLPLLVRFLHQLSTDLNFNAFSHHYFIDFPNICLLNNGQSQISMSDLQKITSPNYMPTNPPSIFKTLSHLLIRRDIDPFPYLSQVNVRTKNIIQLTALITHGKENSGLQLEQFTKLVVPAGSRIDPQDLASRQDRETLRSSTYLAHEKAVLLYHEMGMSCKDLEILPPGVSLLLHEAMHKCRGRPPSDWPTSVYALIDRQDLAALERHSLPLNIDCHVNTGKSCIVKDPEQDDGMEFDDTVLKLRFSKDHRVAEVRRLLNSSKPVRIAIAQRPDVSDHDFIEEQERHLHALCTRTMALPVARGMFTLRTSTPIITEQLPVPRLCLTGKAPPRGTTIELAHIDVPPNMNLWPLFHNGVAAGLRIHPNASNIDSTWIVYNKPQQSEFGIEHAGFLMALGLNGHLKNLAPFNMYEYLVECHETTSVGLLLGLSASHRATMDVSMTKLLSLHVETLLPPTSIELNVQQNIQVAALMGVGLVYQGTAHKHISHALLSEIGRPPGPEMKNCVDRESYSLAAGLALGLVVLGCGGGSDFSSIPDTLHYYMLGGNVRPLTGAQKDKYKSPSYQIREGDSINIDVTSQGATVALGLMYFNTGNRAVAQWMQAPETQFLLDFVRPDLLLLRILARSLILWDEIQPTTSWVSSHVPEIVYQYRLQKPTPEIMQTVDLETMNQAYCNIIAGACLALGLKYAGSANRNAFKTLYNYAQIFTALPHKSVAELAGKSTIETCLNVILLAAAAVMAGTGDLQILRICRYIRTRVGPASSVVTYGSHLATHMALGLLFLGGGRYTLSNSPSAIAALLIALFPKFPTHSNDNRYHLQALRHLYVLAAEPRLLLPRDIDTGRLCYAMVHLTFQSDNLASGQEVVLRAPCLLPELNSLRRVELRDDRYWNVVFEKGQNWERLMNMLERCDFVDVKQRAGCLSYQEDPHGFRSLVAQTLTTENVIAWAAKPENITSFTNDKTVLNIVKNFLQGLTKHKTKRISRYSETGRNSSKTNSSSFAQTSGRLSGYSEDLDEKMEVTESSQTSKNLTESFANDHKISELNISERHLLQTFAIVAYECVVKDKISLLPLWVNLFKSLDVIGRQPNSYLVWQIKLIAIQVLERSKNGGRNLLLSSESALAIKQKTALIMDSWEPDLKPLLKEYLTNGTVEGNSEMLARFTAYFTFYDLPYRINNRSAGDVSMLDLLLDPSNTQLPASTLHKLHNLLRIV
ncbi:anaphase-promoting complex subunit 1 [Diprion similis]|uniref:anaphase-promoting complex subunit 1 n=1 Tax=Diprion similis TaxID=362088 RepID=UPI001EF7B6E8|nr:anaphase-promoting complex subunit 1 [Diprion similis]